MGLKIERGSGRCLGQPQPDQTRHHTSHFQNQFHHPVNNIISSFESSGFHRDAPFAFDPFSLELNLPRSVFSQLETGGFGNANKPQTRQDIIFSYPIYKLAKEEPPACSSKLTLWNPM